MKKNAIVLFVLLFLVSIGLWAQPQIIGQYPALDGGFENHTAGALGNSTTWGSDWLYNTGSASISDTGGRSGPHHLTFSGTTAEVFPPNLSFPTTGYVIQFYYRGDLDGTIGGDLRIICQTDDPQYSIFIANPDTQANWLKRSLLVPSGWTTLLVNYAIQETGLFYLDDVVVYNGGIDIVAPDAPTDVYVSNPTHSTSSLDVSWTAPGTGVDGGGYVVLRYTANPTSEPNPNVNGVYAVGNTIGAGTVAYIGTDTSFTDEGLDNLTHYWYRVYTADKAFNYSTPGTDDGTTPVELSSFNAIVTSDYFVSLTWVTQTETGVAGYNVYRSNNNITPEYRVNINTIPATNTSTQQTYTYIDSENLTMNNTYYYWLENVEMDGTSIMYGPVGVTLNDPGTPPPSGVSILKKAYPNPFYFGGSTTIEVDIKAGETGTVTIYNLRGQIVEEFPNLTGNTTRTWNARGNASGIYFYKLSTPSAIVTRKLVIVN